MDNIKAIYVGDPVGDVESERNEIQENIKNTTNINIKIDIIEHLPKALRDIKFSILFFDWGGMSIGNSLLEHFCEYIVEHAHEHPSREYIVTSLFTENAMLDAIETADNNQLGRPANLFMSVDEWISKSIILNTI